MLDTLHKRLRSNEGFTLIELLVVIIILGILLAIAIPSYLSFRDRANNTAAQANIRAALPDVEQYNADQGSSGYTGMTIALLQANYDKGISPSVKVVGTPTATSYCLESTVGTGDTYRKVGPEGPIEKGKCA